MFGWMRRTWYDDGDAWARLQALGYSMTSYQSRESKGLRCYAILKDGELMTEWSAPITIDQSYKLQRLYANAELKRLKDD